MKAYIKPSVKTTTFQYESNIMLNLSGTANSGTKPLGADIDQPFIWYDDPFDSYLREDSGF